MKNPAFFLLLLLISTIPSQLSASGTEIRCVLKNGDHPVSDTLLSIDLEGLPLPAAEKRFALFRMDGDRRIPLQSQLESGDCSRLWFKQDREVLSNKVVHYLITTDACSPDETALSIHAKERNFSLFHKERKILCYHGAVHDTPPGVDPLFRRSGFIHPLLSPAGKALTRIQPPDHYHHYGLWNPWTRTLINGREVDFWNLGKGQGTVRHAGLIGTCSGPVFCGFKVKQEHVVLDSPQERIAINEVWDLRASTVHIDDREVWLIDFTTCLVNALDCPIELSAYRYGGGLGFRATDDWHKDNCAVLTSEMKTRKDADNTTARWCDLRGGDDNPAGIVFMSHPANHGHPEPMRIWPEDAVDGKGHLFFGFTPTRHLPLVLEPHKEYVLRYRLYVYDGKMEPAGLETMWRGFAHPPRIEVIP